MVTMVEKNLVTRNATAQLNYVVTEDAEDLTPGGNSSDIISQGIGPNPKENANTKIERDNNGIKSILSPSSSPRLSAIKKNPPRPLIDIVIMLEDRMSKVLLPALSITRAAIALPSIMTLLTIMLAMVVLMLLPDCLNILTQ